MCRCGRMKNQATKSVQSIRCASWPMQSTHTMHGPPGSDSWKMRRQALPPAVSALYGSRAVKAALVSSLAQLYSPTRDVDLAPVAPTDLRGPAAFPLRFSSEARREAVRRVLDSYEANLEPAPASPSRPTLSVTTLQPFSEGFPAMSTRNWPAVADSPADSVAVTTPITESGDSKPKAILDSEGQGCPPKRRISRTTRGLDYKERSTMIADDVVDTSSSILLAIMDQVCCLR